MKNEGKDKRGLTQEAKHMTNKSSKDHRNMEKKKRKN